MYDLTRATDRDRLYMSDDSRWPYWPFLPIKRYLANSSGMPELATLAPHPGADKLVRIHAGFWDFMRMNEDEVRLLEKTDYYDVDTLINEGWVVD